MNTKNRLIEKLSQRIAVLEQFIEQQTAQTRIRVKLTKLQANQLEIQAKQIETLTELTEKQADIIKALVEQIEELEKRLSKNSTNSSKPPSSDGLAKSNKSKNNSLREKGKNKSGGQPGHQGKTLRQTKDPDKIVRHKLLACPTCSCTLTNVPEEEIVKRQVFDIPPPTVTVTEHQAEIKICPGCRTRVVATFPEEARAPVQYGPVIQSYAVYLQEQQLLPEERLQQTFIDLFNVSIAKATFTRFSQNVYHHLEVFEAAVLQQIKQASFKHLDETGFRINGKTQWLHVASNKRWTYYHHSPKRKSLIEGLSGTVVHDHWRPYYQLKGVGHVLCNTHHLRELKSLTEDNELWAHQMWRLLRFALRVKHHHGDQAIPQDKQERLLAMYDAIVARGFRYHEQLSPYALKPKRGRTARRPGYNLLLRLKNYRSDSTRFITDVEAPFSNNLAEQDLRMMKVKQKISGGFRSEKGASRFVRIRSFISTARKQKMGIFSSISQAVAGNVLLPT